MSRAARTARLFFVATTRATADFLQHNFQRAEICERRLQQVEADKRGEPEPVGAVVMREQQTGENKRAGKPADKHVHFHIFFFGLFNGNWLQPTHREPRHKPS